MSGRIRTIKPEVLEDERAAALSDAAWRLRMSLWMLADDHGGVRLGSKYVAAHVWQDTGRDVDEPIAELIRKRFLTPYAVAGQRYGRITDWSEQQRVDNAGKPRVPTPDQDDGSWNASPDSNDSDALAEKSRPLAEKPASPEGNPLGSPLARHARAHSSAGITTTIPTTKTTPTTTGVGGGFLKVQEPAEPKSDVDQVYEHWLDCRQRQNPKRQRIKLGAKDRKATQALLDAGRTVEELKLACEGHFLSPHHLGENDRGTPYLEFVYVVGRNNLDAFIRFAEATRAAAVQELEDQPPATSPSGPPATGTSSLAMIRELAARKSASVFPGDSVGAPVFVSPSAKASEA